MNMLDRQFGELRTVFGKEGAGQHQQHLRAIPRDTSKRRCEIVRRVFQLERAKLQTQRLCRALGRAELFGHERIPENAQSGSFRKSLRQQLDFLGG
jgi:hypothetical protein